MPSAASRLMPTLRRVVLAGAAADRTDGQLLGAFVVDRDADAFAGLVRRHGPMVLGVCRRVVGDHAVADDAFQAVFIVLARRAGAVKPREQVGNWLYGVAYRTALKARAVLARRRSREKQVDVMPEPPVSPRIAADWADLQPLIDEELARLPDKLRVPVVLCDLEGRAQRDVAKHLGIPPATLATRIASARRTLAARLTKRGVTLSGGALAGMLSANGTASAVPYALGQSVTRAAEAVALGGVPLVSAHAVQLSEGVMRMMLLTKLKAVAVTALTVAALSGGLGLGLVPAYALGMGDEPASGDKSAAKPAAPSSPNVSMDEFVETKLKDVSIELNADVDDATFLRRLSLDLRGILPTDVESFFFIGDEDEDKRAKVVVWMSNDDEVKAHAAKKLGVPAERVRTARLVDVGNGRRLVVVIDTDDKTKPQALAFSPDGKQLAVELVDRDIVVRAAPTFADFDNDRHLDVFVANDDKRVEVIADKVAKSHVVKGVIAQIQNDAPTVVRGQVILGSDDGKTVKLWDATDNNRPRPFVLFDADDGASNTFWVESFTQFAGGDSDAEFLKRVIQDVRGAAPTALEEKYFAEDKDPKKREKLLDQLLKDPAVARKLGDDWKKKMLGSAQTKEGTFRYRAVPKTVEVKPEVRRWVVPADQSGKYELKLLNEWKPDTPLKLVFPVDPKTGKQKEGVYEWRVAPSGDKKEGVFEWKVEPPARPWTPNVPNPPSQPEPPKVRTVKVAPTTPATPVTPKAPVTRVVPATPATPTTRIAPARPAAPAMKADRLVDLLIAAKKSDADILDFITIDTLGRLPTEAERKLALGLVSKAADRKAAWMEVAKALAATGEGRQRSGARSRDDVIELKGSLEIKDAIELDVDAGVLELKGTIEGAGDVLRLRVNPEVKGQPELKPRANPEVKPVPPAKK